MKLINLKLCMLFLFVGVTGYSQKAEAPYIITNPSNYTKCVGESVTFTVVAGGYPNNYQWKKNGVNISGATGESYIINNITLGDAGSYTCFVYNGAGSVTSSPGVLTVNDIPNVTAQPENVILCEGIQNTEFSISATGTSLVYQWQVNTGSGWSNIITTGINPTYNNWNTSVLQLNNIIASNNGYQYRCIVSGICIPNATSNSALLTIRTVYQNEQICIVTVDTSIWKNKIIWEKTPGVGTESFNIYKEISYNNYNLIGNVTYNNPSYFTDSSSNPESHSDRYKISVIDTCNNESSKSAYHNTMNLIVSVFGSTMGLVWTEYETEDGSYIPDLYYIYKGPTPQTMSLLTTVSGSQNTYNDPNVFNFQYYLIGVSRDCNTNQAFSNKRDNGLVGINTASLTGTIFIAPNPMANTTTLTIPNFNTKTTEPLQIMDITGKVVKIINISNVKFDNNKAEIVIERGDLKPGVYFVELKTDRTYRGKLIIE